MEGIKLGSNAEDETELESFSVWSDQYQKGAIIIDASPMVNSGNIRPAEPDDMRVLLDKLVLFAIAPDNNNDSQLYQTNNSAIRRINSDSTSQTTIREVRMRGKTAYILRFPVTITASQLLSSSGVTAIRSHIRPNS